jgi:hypothetical protein
MDFLKGACLGEMHGHEPSARGPLGAGGYSTKAIIEIDDEQATIIASSIGRPASALRRDGKQAHAVASNDEQVIVLYFYDSSFFLTTLTTY